MVTSPFSRKEKAREKYGYTSKPLLKMIAPRFDKNAPHFYGLPLDLCGKRIAVHFLPNTPRFLPCQIIEPVTFARCAFIFELRNIALCGYLDTRRNI